MIKKISQIFAAILAVATLWACGEIDPSSSVKVTENEGVSLFFSSEYGADTEGEYGADSSTNPGKTTKSIVKSDGRNVSWSEGDEVSLWAKNESGSWTIENQEFSLYAKNGMKAWFSTTVDQPMPEGSYKYYCSYPKPLTVKGNEVSFKLPSIQDGLAGSGADIMIATPAESKQLSELPVAEDHSSLSLKFNHLVHLLRFYIPEGSDGLEGESVRRLVITMPKSVVGKIKADITNPGEADLSEGENVIRLDLLRPIGESLGQRDYACASIFPTAFEEGESMTVKIYTDSKVGTTAPINLRGRDMKAGHATSVPLLPISLNSIFRINFHVDSNNLGEDAQKITLTAPNGCRWSDSGTNILVHEPGTNITKGYSFDLEFEDESAYRSLSNASVTVTYDSEHITISEDIDLQDMSSGQETDISLNIPYLLYEDFSDLKGFMSNDEYATSSAGSKSPTSFLNGWTGARVGGETGKCIRIACRRETSSDYHARVESAPLKAVIKKPVDLSVSFDYGANNKFGGVAIVTDGNVGQNVFVGYVTNSKGYNSGDQTGNYESENSFYVKEYTGSYSNTPNDWTAVIHSAPAGNVFRVSWRTQVEHQAGTTNTTAWLYIDNVKVQVKK